MASFNNVYYQFGYYYYCLFILTANEFLPGGSGTALVYRRGPIKDPLVN
jgi:uncharacterized membrane protein